MSRRGDAIQWLWVLGRVALSIGLLWYVLTNVGLDTIVDHVLAVPAWVAATALVLAFVNIAISAYKWQLTLRLRDIDLPWRELFVYYYIGQFFNAFLPTTIGGDSARMYYLYDRHPVGQDAVSSVVIERATGLVSVFLLAGIGGIVLAGRISSMLAAGIVLGSAIGILIAAGILFSRWLRALLDRTVYRIQRLDIGHRLGAVHDAVLTYRDRPRALLVLIGISLVFRGIVVLNTIIVASGLGMDVSLGYFLVIVPVVEILLLIPISIQGFGVRETTYLYLFTAVGATEGVAVALGIVMQLVLTVFNNLVGAVFYIMDGLRR